MEKSLNIKTNIIFNVVCQLVIYISPLLISPYVSRVLLPEGVGQYSHAYSYVYYFSVIIAFGFSSLGIKKISENRSDKIEYSRYFWAIMSEKVLITILVGATYLGILLSTCFNGKVNLGVGLSLLLVLAANCLDIRFLFQGLENFRIVTIGTMLVNVLYVVFVYLFVKSPDDLVLYTIIKSSLDLGINFFLLFFSSKLIRRASFGLRFLWTVFKGSATYFLPNLLMTIHGQIDQSILGSCCGDTEVGFYTIAKKLPDMITCLTFAISPVIFSRISLLYKEGKKEETKCKITQSLLLATFMSVPCCCGLAALADVLVPLYFGAEYVQSVRILYYLLPSSIASPLASIVIYGYFYPAGKTRKMFIYQAFSIALNVGITLLCVLVFNMGAVGAALGTSLCNAVLLGLLLFSSRGFIDAKAFWEDAWKILAGGLLIFGAVFVFNCFVSLKDIYLILIDIVVGVLIFALTVVITKEYVWQLGLETARSKLTGRKEK